MRVLFGDFVLDLAARQLLRDGAERHLEPKAFELLQLLVEHRPRAVAKAEILERLWPDTFVSESSLTRLIALVRRALGEGSSGAKCVRTVHGFGYAFSAEVVEGASQEAAGPVVARVIWLDRALPLTAGPNILGRGEDVSLCIDAPGVSRRHARIVLGAEGAVLEDLGSKNGTFLHDRRLEAPAALENGDTFQLGQQLLVFRLSPRTAATITESERNRRSD
jgi:DNA-binding winged helix-turn-helix (wHTH) protein